MADYAFQTVNLTKKYGTATILKNVNFHVPKGSIYGLVGPNGAGKSTLLRILLGASSCTEGYIAINGKTEDDDLCRERVNVGSIIESPTLYATMSAIGNLICRCKLLGISNARQKSMEILDYVGLQDTGKKKVSNFSLGMKQRLALGIALISQPQLLVLDEPTNGLDPVGIQQIRNIIKKLNADGVTILISSHLLTELSKLATHYGILNHGVLLKEVAVNEVLDQCKDTLKIIFDSVAETSKAIEVLLKIVGQNNFEILSGTELKVSIKGTNLTSTDITRHLVENSVNFLSVNADKEDFEEYFFKVINGEV